MRKKPKYSLIKQIVLVMTGTLLLLWIGLHAESFFTTQNGFIRAVLSILFAVMILLRPKPEPIKHQISKTKNQKHTPSPLLPTLSIIAGILCTVTGLIFTIHQLEWIGILLLTGAGLRFALPSGYFRDIPLSLFVLYWANPLPNQAFGLLQIWMQIASVNGSEWLLHIFNVRVWGDELILRTDVYVFEVPAWCSGMRTATTVFILSIALGILRRMRWHETAFFTIWSLFHALVLNIIRISIMVVFAQNTKSSAGLEFLHNTAGIIVVGGVLIVYIEMLYLEHLRRWQHHINTEINHEHFKNISEYPPFWKRILMYRKRLIIITLIIALIGTVAYRSRPYHKAMMIKDVATALRDQGDLEIAQRASKVVSELIPDDLEWKFVVARLQIICGKHEQAIQKLQSLHNTPAEYLTTKKVLTAYALMCLGNIDQAAEIVAELPDDIRESDPRIAMIMAEMALRGDNPNAVGEHIIVAAGWTPNVGRIRNLYPYLHIHRKWKAMTNSDINIPYNDPVQAFSILEAYMNLDQVPEVANITMQIIERWPNDMRALEPLYFMAIKRGISKWEDRFATYLLNVIKSCNNPDQLYETMYKTFAISRPDLSWAIYDRITEIDPKHPTLYMSVAKYGHKWFKFRKRYLSIPSTSQSAIFDLKPFFILSQQLPEWNYLAKLIPNGQQLAVTDATPIRKKFLKKAIKAFSTKPQDPSTQSPVPLSSIALATEEAPSNNRYPREHRTSNIEHPTSNKSTLPPVSPPLVLHSFSGGGSTPNPEPPSHLSLDMQYLYAKALEMNSRVDLAKHQLESIAKHYPKESERVRIMLSEIYERKGDWINVYENLRTYLNPRSDESVSTFELNKMGLTWPPKHLPKVADDKINLKPLLRLIKAQHHLNLRIGALHNAREAVRLFPYSSQATELLAQAHLELGDSESALQVLEQPRPRRIQNLDVIEVSALFNTERYTEVNSLCRRSMLPPWRIPPDTVQHTSLPPAELALLWHRVSTPSEKQFAENSTLVRANLSSASPGLRKLLALWLKAYDQRCEGDLADTNTWIECGRDPIECAVALNQLTLLLCREERYAEAKEAALKAVSALPTEPLLWQILISLSDDISQTISLARESCPDSDKLWLAELVHKTHKSTAPSSQHPVPSNNKYPREHPTSNIQHPTSNKSYSPPEPSTYPQKLCDFEPLCDKSPQNPAPQLPAPSSQHPAPSTTPEWINKTITEAIDKQMPPATITRACEYLWRNDMRPEAIRLARSITDRARGLLPTYIVSMRCALHANDEKWALASTEKAIQSALQPLPEFYKNFVLLKTSDGNIDVEPDMVNALRNLCKSDPDNPQWAQMLGYIRFQRGGWEIVDAMVQMQTAINNGATNLTPYLIASEASRLLQNYDRAADILKQGLQRHKNNPILINNLAFTLTHAPERKDEMLAIIPKIKELSQHDDQIKDTLTALYIKTGDLDLAQKTVTEMLKDAQPGSSIWFRAKTYLAEIAIQRGQKRDASAILMGLLKNLKDIPDEDILNANKLLSQINEENLEEAEKAKQQ